MFGLGEESCISTRLIPGCGISLLLKGIIYNRIIFDEIIGLAESCDTDAFSVGFSGWDTIRNLRRFAVFIDEQDK